MKNFVINKYLVFEFLKSLMNVILVFACLGLIMNLFEEINKGQHTFEYIPAQIMAYKNLHEINVRIKDELESLKDNIELSKQYWFTYFRTAPYHENLINLKRFKKILDSRLELVFRLQNV